MSACLGVNDPRKSKWLLQNGFNALSASIINSLHFHHLSSLWKWNWCSSIEMRTPPPASSLTWLLNRCLLHMGFAASQKSRERAPIFMKIVGYPFCRPDMKSCFWFSPLAASSLLDPLFWSLKSTYLSSSQNNIMWQIRRISLASWTALAFHQEQKWLQRYL